MSLPHGGERVPPGSVRGGAEPVAPPLAPHGPPPLGAPPMAPAFGAPPMGPPGSLLGFPRISYHFIRIS